MNCRQGLGRTAAKTASRARSGVGEAGMVVSTWGRHVGSGGWWLGLSEREAVERERGSRIGLGCIGVACRERAGHGRARVVGGELAWRGMVSRAWDGLRSRTRDGLAWAGSSNVDSRCEMRRAGLGSRWGSGAGGAGSGCHVGRGGIATISQIGPGMTWLVDRGWLATASRIGWSRVGQGSRQRWGVGWVVRRCESRSEGRGRVVGGWDGRC